MNWFVSNVIIITIMNDPWPSLAEFCFLLITNYIMSEQCHRELQIAQWRYIHNDYFDDGNFSEMKTCCESKLSTHTSALHVSMWIMLSLLYVRSTFFFLFTFCICNTISFCFWEILIWFFFSFVDELLL